MTAPVIAFFNNRGGVGKTFLVYHIGWMLAELGYRVVAADLDPQGNLTAACLNENRLEPLWPEDQSRATAYGAIEPLKRGGGDLLDPLLEPVDDDSALLPDENLVLIPGDMSLSNFEEDLSQAWQKCLEGEERAFRMISAFWRLLQRGATLHRADVVLMDLGPNLGAINRAALTAADFVVIPMGPDLFSIQALRNLGPRLRLWRREWSERLPRNPTANLSLPAGRMQTIGYVVTQHSERWNPSLKVSRKWTARIPAAYQKYAADHSEGNVESVLEDKNCLAVLKHFRALMPMALEVRKPLFFLKPADGAMGAFATATHDAYREFRTLALKIAERAGVRPENP